ncbi:MAG: Deoxycytidine monophosphate (dCMP) deaminase [Watsoniomyces obsoletus]|nr:MAG: Deoxycytidine monophosphate (dCMP) deaminase [Watsoniomyces obsoletus]
MSSSVFYHFKSQKDPSRVTFDGTGISVFELKRSIITENRLGDGTDFDLTIYNEDKYDDDSVIIPRSTSIVACRLPPSKPGRGSGARYVSGKMPLNAKNSSRVEKPISKAAVPGKGPRTSTAASDMAKAQTEEEKIAAMFKAGAEQWDQQQQEMANATPVHRQGGHRGGSRGSAPDRPVPSGYICYRCGDKGHWIQACPTNNDPYFDNRPRVKRTTGIPKSFLRTIEKPASLSADGITDTGHHPSGVMVNADGEFVVAEPDQASWEQFQARTRVVAVARQEAESNVKELESWGVKCDLDNKLYVDPVKTPCCQRTYCNECITNSLIENDLTCPACEKKEVLLDDMKPDDEMVTKVTEYLADKQKKEDEKTRAEAGPSNANDHSTASNDQTTDAQMNTNEATKEAAEKEKAPSVQADGAPSSVDSASQPTTPQTPTSSATQSVPSVDTPAATNGASKKRPAEDELPNERPAQAPKMEKSTSQSSHGSNTSSGRVAAGPSNRPGSSQSSKVPMLPTLPMLPITTGPASYSGPPFYGGNLAMAYSGPPMNNYNGIPLTMGPVMPINPAMMNFPNMNGVNGYGNNMMMMMNGYGNQAGGGNFMPPQQQQQYGRGCDNGYNGMGMPNGGYNNNYGPNMGHMGNGGMGMDNGGMGRNMGNHGMGMNGNMPMNNHNNNHHHRNDMGRGYGQGRGGGGGGPKFQQQQPPPEEEDSAYFRRPVNRRHQARQRPARPSDYREL